jgi:hypothetical protein
MEQIDEIQAARTRVSNARAAEVFTLTERLTKTQEDANAAALVIGRHLDRRAELRDAAVQIACMRNAADGALRQMPEEIRNYAEDVANQMLDWAIAAKAGGK